MIEMLEIGVREYTKKISTPPELLDNTAEFDESGYNATLTAYHEQSIAYHKSMIEQHSKALDSGALDIQFSITSAVKAPERRQYVIGADNENKNRQMLYQWDQNNQTLNQTLRHFKNTLALLRMSDEEFVTIRQDSQDWRWFQGIDALIAELAIQEQEEKAKAETKSEPNPERTYQGRRIRKVRDKTIPEA